MYRRKAQAELGRHNVTRTDGQTKNEAFEDRRTPHSEPSNSQEAETTSASERLFDLNLRRQRIHTGGCLPLESHQHSEQKRELYAVVPN